MWRNGKPVGVGKKVYPDGKFKEGYWDKGKFIEGSKNFTNFMLCLEPPEGFLEALANEKDLDVTTRNEVDDNSTPALNLG